MGNRGANKDLWAGGILQLRTSSLPSSSTSVSSNSTQHAIFFQENFDTHLTAHSLGTPFFSVEVALPALATICC